MIYTNPVEANPIDQVASIVELVRDMNSGAVDTLLILGGNPVYDAPADLNFLEALKKIAFRAHLGLYSNETAAWCHWHVPEAHYLESWSDARAYDGTASIVQPLIAPLYNGKTPHDILNVLLNRTGKSAHDTVQDYWRAQHKGADFEDFWKTSLFYGVIDGTAFAEVAAPEAKVPAESVNSASGIEIVFRPDPAIGDGAFSNNAWLQELPKPQNTMTWDNAVWISPESARHYQVETGDVVEISANGRKIQGAVWVLPGHADESVTLHFGYGRTRGGKVADGVGFDVYPMRASNAVWHTAGGAIQKKSHGYRFAVTQNTQTMEERDPFRAATFDEYHKNPEFADPPEKLVPDDESLFPLWPYKAHKWGMSIDLSACVGCQACSVACQAENNIAVVGKEQVALGRVMHWIRVDRYYNGPMDDPQTFYQPVPCMHCENALCELVCPVAATVHSGEGLNEMVYNRCVGTRYCSNNCPYKVRRFNFLLYSDWDTQSLWGVRNPDVSVRSRGVMEKCSYCVQRINRAKIDAEKAGRGGEGRRHCHGVPAGLSGAGDRVWRYQRRQQQGGEAEAAAARLRTAFRAGYASAHHLPGETDESESRLGEGVKECPRNQNRTSPSSIPDRTRLSGRGTITALSPTRSAASFTGPSSRRRSRCS